MYINSKPKKRPSPKDLDLEVLQKLHAESLAFIQGNEPDAVTSLKAELENFWTVLDNIAQGVCFFNADQRLILSNRRYAEIYHLRPQDISPGMSLREIVARRTAVGTGPAVGAEDYLSEGIVINQNSDPTTRTAKLLDGREIAMWNQPMPDGGWVTTHDDISENKLTSTSLQTLIDWVPDLLFVKDLESRFLVANEATATDLSSVINTKPVTRAELIGKNDFDFYPR
jgi:PAS fold